MAEAKQFNKAELEELEKEMGVNIYDDDDFQGVTAFFKHDWIKKFLFVIGVIVIGIPVFEIFAFAFPPNIQRPVHIMLMYTIVFMVYPSGFFKNKKIETALNLILIALIIAICIWARLRWVPLYIYPDPQTYEVVFTFLFIFLTFEAIRRSIGMAMSIIAFVFLLYCFVGPYMPRFFAHVGFEPSQLVTQLVIGTEGMLGDLMSTGCTQIVFFMLFASFLKISNATNLFMDFSKAIAGHLTGGPAKVAVVSSGFMGMLSGSASGNVATTGSVTIPLMISMGFKRHVAAAIEAVSSTAGQFMPPIMGAAAFVIAEYTGNTYWAVCIAAFLPSVLYFTCMFFVVDVRARKQGMTGLPKDQLPDFKESAKKVVPLLIPITVLVILLSLQFSTQFAVMYSIVALILSYLPFKEKRVGIVKILKAMALASKIMIPITTSCAGCGLIVGIMSMTGFGERLAYGILSVANGNLFIGLAFTALMCVILGMGLPTLAAYIVLAALGVPALVQLGAPMLAAHLFVFYFAILSAITPPVCLSAYVGAGIAGAKPMKVGVTAMTMAPFIYFLPFMFVIWPGLLFNAPLLIVGKNFLEFVLFMFPLIIVPQQFWFTKMSIVETILFSLSTISFFFMKDYALISMIILFGAGAFLHFARYIREKRKAAVA